MGATKEYFETTRRKMNSEVFLKCDCTACQRENCPHRDALRRLPKIYGGLGMCPNLKK